MGTDGGCVLQLKQNLQRKVTKNQQPTMHVAPANFQLSWHLFGCMTNLSKTGAICRYSIDQHVTGIGFLTRPTINGPGQADITFTP